MSFAGEQQIHGVDVADLLDELDGRPAERVDRPPHLGQPEAGVGSRGPDVGGEQQLEAAAHAVAVDGGDDRLRVGVLLQQRMADDAGPSPERAERSPLMSAPALKAWWPAPVRTMQR